jgi:hypothetical protein
VPQSANARAALDPISGRNESLPMPIKATLKRALGRLFTTDALEKLTEYSIAAREPSVSLEAAETITAEGSSWNEIVDAGRRILWGRTLERIGAADILLLEFGVWKGDSTRHFVTLNRSARSLFYGFDSFEGLPEDWRGMTAQRFDVGGALPQIDDDRVTFVKGWFRDTLPPLLDSLEEKSEGRAVIVHFDADLFSSTLYLLFTLGTKFKHYHFIFDEFSGHETRALYNYIQATGAEAKFYYRLDWQGCPQVVSGEIRLP